MHLDFSEALKLIKSGLCLSRKNWDMRFKYVQKTTISENIPAIFCTMHNGESFLWTPTNDDIMAEDWFVEVNID